MLELQAAATSQVVGFQRLGRRPSSKSPAKATEDMEVLNRRESGVTASHPAALRHARLITIWLPDPSVNITTLYAACRTSRPSTSAEQTGLPRRSVDSVLGQNIGSVRREAREATFRESCGSGGVEADGVAETVGVVGDASYGSLGSRVAW
jgi:hypothetical protein